MTPAYVVGSGIAGLRFSLFLAEHRPVVIITKKAAVESNTNYAQGGIAAAFGSDDSVDLHLQDTLNTGCGLTDPDIARIVVTEGPELIRELMDMGANFARDKKGELDLGREGGHSRNRVVHSADATGRVVERVLLNAAEAHPNITVQPFHLAIDLIVEDNAVGGLVIMTDTGEIKKVPAALVCLTTGGVGRVFHYTTNPEIATGDGIAMGFRAGAKIRDMEFVQFHPTALARSGTGAFLISEAVRGEGGKLRLINGDPFMEHYDPERLELAPRDIVARAIDTELKRTGDPHVLLDVTHLDSNFVKKRFPTIYSTCLVHGIEIDKEPIPVVPAAHYSCGGIVTDDRARSSVQGLYAVGETASHGLHGANRLASNSLLEALVFSRRGAETAAGEADRAPLFAPEILDYSSRPTCGLAGLYIHQLTSAMSEFVGIFRRKDSLRKAQLQVSAILEGAKRMRKIYSPKRDMIELSNMVRCADLIVRSALKRNESRGLHALEGVPFVKSDEYINQHTVLENETPQVLF